MNDIGIQGGKPKNKDTREWNISDRRAVRIKEMR